MALRINVRLPAVAVERRAWRCRFFSRSFMRLPWWAISCVAMRACEFKQACVATASCPQAGMVPAIVLYSCFAVCFAGAAAAAGPASVLNVIAESPAFSGGEADSETFRIVADNAVALKNRAVAEQRSSEEEALSLSHVNSVLSLRLKALRGSRPVSGAGAVSMFKLSGGATSADIRGLVRGVEAGGRVAQRALRNLIDLAASGPDAHAILASSGAVQAADTLLKRPSSDSSTRHLAGSLITMLSGMPVAAEVSNERTGAGERVDIVLPRPSRVYGPDQVELDLSAGVLPGHVW